MKALVYEKAHSLDDFAIRLAELPEPTLRDLDVLVDVRAIGVNPGEAVIRKTRSAEPGGHVLLGWEFSGVITATGKSVKRLKIGDRVFGTGDMTRDGAWAERVAVDHRVVSVIPDDLAFVDAASIPIGAATAWEAMFRDEDALPKGVDRVLIVGGAGGVGSMATQLLKATSNAFVISTASRPESKQWCTEMGADLVLDYTGDVPGKLRAARIPHVDMVLSTSNSMHNVEWISSVLRPFGHLCIVDGVSSLNLGPLMMKSASVHIEMVFSRIINGINPQYQGDILDAVSSLVMEGNVRSIAKTRLTGLTPSTMETAHALLESRRSIGKVVIEL